MKSDPPASGSIESTRIASLMPANPASTAASMKLPTLIRLVGTPASRAPIGLPPVATVCTPHRVLARITWMITVITTAQMNPENRAPPRMSAKPPSGAGFGKPSEIVSVNPLRKNSIPSVVMNDGTPVVTVRIPLMRPDERRRRAGRSTTASGSGSPHSVPNHITNGVIP